MLYHFRTISIESIQIYAYYCIMTVNNLSFTNKYLFIVHGIRNFYNKELKC